MAEFNPEPQKTTDPSYLSLSKPTKDYAVDRSYERLFQGIGDFITAGVQGTDINIKRSADKEVYESMDRVRDQTISQLENSLNHLTSAKDQGALKESDYWTRLDSEVRKIRSRYPGYREHIDQSVAQIVGGTPANSRRSELQNELEKKLSGGSSDYDKQLTFLRQNLEHLRPGEAAILAQTAYGRQIAPDEMSRMYSSIYERSKLKADNDLKKSGIDVYQAETGAKKTNAIHESYGIAARIVQDQLKNITTELKIDPVRWNRIINNEELPKPEEIEYIRRGLNTFERRVSDLLDMELKTPYRPGGRSPSAVIGDDKEVQQVIANALSPITRIKNFIGNKEFGLAEAQNRVIAGIKTDATYRLLAQKPELATVDGLRDMLGNEGFTYLLSQRGPDGKVNQLQPRIIESMNLIDLNRTFQFPTPEGMQAKIDRSASEVGRPLTSQELRSKFDAYQRPFVDPETKPEAKIKMAADMFGPASLGVLSNWDQKDHVKAFSYWISPEVTKNMLELKNKGGEGEQAWKNYKMWAISNFSNLLQNDARAVQEGIEYRQYVDIKWTGEQFSAKPTPKAEAELRNLNVAVNPYNVLDQIEMYFTRGTITAMNNLNEMIRSMKPILEADKQDLGTEVVSLLNLNLTAGKKSSVWTIFKEAMESSGTAAREGVGGVFDVLYPDRNKPKKPGEKDKSQIESR